MLADRVAEVAFIPVEDMTKQIFLPIPPWQVEEGENVVARLRCREPFTLGQNRADQRHQIVAGNMRRQSVDRWLRRAVGHIVQNLSTKHRLRAFIHLGEIRRNAGFQRETAQHGGTEGVDGLDLETAGRFDGACKECARMGQQRIGNGVTRQPKVQQVGAQLVIRLHRPRAQPLEQAVLHLRRRGLGIGQAEHPLRRYIL